MKTILITGATGQVGSIYIDYLLENTDLNIVGMMRWQEPLDNIRHLTDRINKKDRLTLYNADLTDYSSLQRMISDVKPDYITHLAAQSFPKTSFDSPLETLNTNIMGTANLLEAIRQQKDATGYNPVIHVVSSSEVYGKASSNLNGAEVLIGEATPFHGASPYAISKIGTDFLSRYYAEAFQLRTVVTRMGTHSGARRSDVFFESTLMKQIAMIEAGMQEPTIKLGNLDSIRTFQDTRDAVRAYWMLTLELEKGNIPIGDYFNIAGVEKFKLTEVLDLALKMSTNTNIKVVQDPNRVRPIDADYQLFSCEKFNKAVPEWHPEIKMQTMFQELLDYWRKEVKEGRIPLER